MGSDNSIQSTLRTVQRATLPLALLAFLAAAPASAASWSHWPLDAGGGAKFRAEFEPAADSRFTSFSRNAGLNYYTSTYCGMDYPGSIAIHCDECGGGAESIQGGAFRMELAVFAVDRDKSGAPALPEDTHFASNPVLPFGTPPGDMGRAILTSSAEFPAGAEFPLRAALPLLGRRHRLLARDNHLLRVCWALRAVTPDGERLLARGILPDAFLPPGAYGLDTATLLIGTATDAKHKEGRTLPATPFSFGNWPFLASHIAAVRVEPGGEALISKQLGGGDEVFFRRLSLLGIGVSATDPESEALRAAAKAPPPLVFPNCGQPRQSNDSLFSTLRPIMGIKGPKDKSDLTGDQRLKAAEVDGSLLGRDTRRFAIFTVAAIAATLAAAVALLLRYFAFRRGEARLPVWRMFPAGMIAAALAVLAASALLLDRSTRLDITQWRYAPHGAAEGVVVECARASSLDNAPVRWTFPSDGWFFAEDLDDAAALHDDGRGTMSLLEKRATVGALRSASAMKFFATGGARFSVTPDAEASPERLAPAFSADGDGNPDAAAALRKVLSDWAQAMHSAPRGDPGRVVTAHGDYSGVWIFARGSWYELGAMRDGEERRVAESMRITSATLDIEFHRKDCLFRLAPFSTAAGEIATAAEAWLAFDGGDSGKGAAASRVGKDFVERLDDAMIVAIRDVANPATFMGAEWDAPLPHRRRTTTRVVDVEVFE